MIRNISVVSSYGDIVLLICVSFSLDIVELI